jgi:hypothetical protein
MDAIRIARAYTRHPQAQLKNRPRAPTDTGER